MRTEEPDFLSLWHLNWEGKGEAELIGKARESMEHRGAILLMSNRGVVELAPRAEIRREGLKAPCTASRVDESGGEAQFADGTIGEVVAECAPAAG
jgi:hypothetical protein